MGKVSLNKIYHENLLVLLLNYFKQKATKTVNSTIKQHIFFKIQILMDAYQSNKEAKSCSVEGCEKRSKSCVSSVFTKLKKPKQWQNSCSKV